MTTTTNVGLTDSGISAKNSAPVTAGERLVGPTRHRVCVTVAHSDDSIDIRMWVQAYLATIVASEQLVSHDDLGLLYAS